MNNTRPDQPRTFELAWSDEFDGTVDTPIDPANWQPEIGGHGWGNDQLQYYTDDPANASLDGSGNLAITVHRSDESTRDKRFGGCAYTSARLITKDRVAVTYGLVEARMKISAGAGIWPAFWMLGQDIDHVGWPRCGEIDIMENFGTDPRSVHGTIHGPGYAGGEGITSAHRPSANLSDDFHQYAVHWGPDRITWYVDNTHYATVARADLGDRPWVFDHDMYLLLNVAVGGAFSQPPDPSATFPQMLLVDYVRIFTPTG